MKNSHPAIKALKGIMAPLGPSAVARVHKWASEWLVEVNHSEVFPKDALNFMGDNKIDYLDHKKKESLIMIGAKTSELCSISKSNELDSILEIRHTVIALANKRNKND